MALNSVLHWFLTLNGDGTTASVIVDVSTAPLVFAGVSSSFNISSTLPIAVSNVGSSNGQVIDASLSSSSLTITFPSAPEAGTQVVVQGDFLF